MIDIERSKDADQISAQIVPIDERQAGLDESIVEFTLLLRSGVMDVELGQASVQGFHFLVPGHFPARHHVVPVVLPPLEYVGFQLHAPTKHIFGLNLLDPDEIYKAQHRGHASQDYAWDPYIIDTEQAEDIIPRGGRAPSQPRGHERPL